MSLALYPPNCADNCAEYELPVLSFDDCNPEVNESQITKLYFTKPENPHTNWENAAEWSDRLSNTSTDDDAIRALTVIGGMPLPEKQEKQISGKRTVFVGKKRTINFTVDELNQTNYDGAINLQCIRTVLFWFETTGGKLYGGNAGIEASIDLDLELSESTGELEMIKGTLKWEHKFIPERIDSPIA